MDFASCTSSNVCVFARVLVCKLLGGSCHFQFCGLQVLSRLLLSICYSFRNLKQFGALASFKVEIGFPGRVGDVPIGNPAETHRGP